MRDQEEMVKHLSKKGKRIELISEHRLLMVLLHLVKIQGGTLQKDMNQQPKGDLLVED